MIKLGIVGMGGIGNHHLTALESVKGCRVTAGADIAKSARDGFKKRCPQCAVFRDHKSMLKSADIDAVLVFTPTLTHKEITVDALRSGRPVLTEKPMARTVRDCKRMIDVADKAGQLLMVAQCRRFDKDWGRFAQLLKDGKVGRPVLWRSIMANTGPGRWYMDDEMGGGPLMDGAVHNYDFANYIFGDPESVVASGIDLTKRSAVDTATAIVQYQSGDQLMMCWSWGPRGDTVHDVLGPKGTILFGPGDMKPKGEEGCAYYRLWLNGKDQKLIQFKYRGLDMYIKEDQNFIDALNGKRKCLCQGTVGIKGVAVAEAVLEAARKRGTVAVRW